MGILQTWILEWVAIAFSRGSSQPGNWTQLSCIAGRFFTIWATREVLPTQSYSGMTECITPATDCPHTPQQKKCLPTNKNKTRKLRHLVLKIYLSETPSRTVYRREGRHRKPWQSCLPENLDSPVSQEPPSWDEKKTEQRPYSLCPMGAT